jgi:DNA-binding SARP family transcriptional activator
VRSCDEVVSTDLRTHGSCAYMLERHWSQTGEVEVRLFGPVELVGDDGFIVDVGAPKVRQLLAVLASDPGRVRSVDVIADTLWGDEPPASTSNLTQGYVSALRRLLGAGRVQRRGAGYLLELDAERVDLVRFERGLASARNLLGNDPERALGLLVDCSMLARGPVFADIATNGVLTSLKTRIDESVIEVDELRVEAELRCGGHIGLVSRLEELTTLHPLREAFWAQLALALYRCGRQAEALRRCQEIRSLLGEQIGVSPGPRLTDVEQRIVRQDRSLDWAPPDRPIPRVSFVGRSEPTLVGRRAELDRLADRLNRAASGQQLVLIGGEPGIGKTRLAIEVAHLAASNGAVALHGRCDEHVNEPCLPFVAALSDHLRTLDDAEVRRLIDDRHDEVEQVLPGVAFAARSARPSASRTANLSMLERFEIVSWLLDRVRVQSPLVLILDDLQWADSTTLALLGYLSSGSRLTGSLILATYRSTELAQDSRLADLLLQLRSSPHAERMLLTGLSRADIDRFLTLGNVSADDEGFAAWIHDETGGNPLFVRELVRHVEATGQRAGFPKGVEEVLTRRIRRLSANTQTMLTRAAVLGSEFSVALLRAMNVDLPDLGPSVDEAVRAGILDEIEVGDQFGFRFAHSTIRRAVTELSSIVTREELHLRAAHALQSLDVAGTAPTAIAAHFVAAGSAAPVDDAIAAFTTAGRHADDKWAKAEAVQWYDRALAILAPDDDRRRALRLTRFVSAQAAWHWHHDQRSIRQVSEGDGDRP